MLPILHIVAPLSDLTYAASRAPVNRASRPRTSLGHVLRRARDAHETIGLPTAMPTQASVPLRPLRRPGSKPSALCSTPSRSKSIGRHDVTLTSIGVSLPPEPG